MGLDDPAAHCEAEARPFGAVPEKRLEDALARGLRNARPTVGNLETIVSAIVSSRHLDRPASARLAGVPQQIGEQLAHARRVGNDGCRLEPERDVCTAQLAGFLEAVRDLAGSRERDEIFRDSLTGVRFLVEDAQFLAQGRVMRFRNHRAQISADDADGIVDLVGHTRGELSDRRKPLARDQACLALA